MTARRDWPHAFMGHDDPSVPCALGRGTCHHCGSPHEPGRDLPDRPRIVCLCGSTRFADEFMAAQFRETLAGRIVLTVGCFPRKPDGSWDQMQVTQEQKVALDALHFRKIELADEVLVLNVGGYIGESTRNEIAHARAVGRPVRFLEPVP